VTAVGSYSSSLAPSIAFVVRGRMDSELQKRYNRLEAAARKAVQFKKYVKHSIYCSEVSETETTCDCGLSDLRAALGVKHVR